MREISAVFVIASAIVSTSCVSTQIGSAVAPEFAGRSYRRILTFAPYSDLILRVAAEQQLALYNDSTRAVLIPSHTVFFPGRDYSSDEVTAAMRRLGIEATLIITPGDSGQSQGYLPPSYSSSCSWSASTGGCRSAAVGGVAYSSAWARHTARLYDAQSGSVVWIASLSSQGDLGAQMPSVVRSMASSVLGKLTEDRIINWQRPARPR